MSVLTFLGPALTLPIAGVVLLLIIILLTSTTIHSNCIYSSPYFVFLSRKSPHTAGSRLHDMPPCMICLPAIHDCIHVIIIMLSARAYMRFPGWSTGGQARLLVESRPRTQIHTKCYCTECIPPIHFAYILILLMVPYSWWYGIGTG